MIITAFIGGFFAALGVMAGLTVYTAIVFPIMVKIGIVSLKKKPVQKQATAKKEK